MRRSAFVFGWPGTNAECVGPDRTNAECVGSTGTTLADPFAELQVFGGFAAGFFASSYLGGGMTSLFFLVSGCLAA